MLADVVSDFLIAQIQSGAQAIQLFDSWAGSALSPDDYQRYALPYSQKIFEKLKQTEVPTIHFSLGAGTYLPLIKAAGSDVVGLDWRTPLDWGWQTVGYDVAVQGNLDPVALFGPLNELEQRVQHILTQADNRPGHIFNLGHGILPQTPVDHVRAVVEMVHEFSHKRS
jgi:uroporphyrinogen decarboxylase